MTSFYHLVFISVIFIGCNSQRNVEPKSSKTSDTLSSVLYERDTFMNTVRLRPNYFRTKIDTSNIKLSFFDKIPETIEYRGEFYTYDTVKLASNKYIFLTDLVEFAIIKNNGKDVYLKKEYEKCLSLPQDTYKDIYSGNGFQVTFIHKIIEDGYGISNEIGKIIIENSKHQSIIKIHGGYNMDYR